jgi:antitoxin (DNA-binding transcriptional repressor) of toxin-antitoxin stability system
MPSTVTVEEAQARLKELIEALKPGEELIIVSDEKPVARLVSEPSRPHLRPPPGRGKGWITILADDDEHLQDFQDYMPCGS